ALTYLFAPDEKQAVLSSCSGIEPGGAASPRAIDLAETEAWPASEVLERGHPVIVDGLAVRFGALPTGPWDRPPARAVVAPIAKQGQPRPAGFLVAAVNPYRPLDPGYRDFIGLLAGQIAAGLSNARAYQEERRRSEALAELDRAKT